MSETEHANQTNQTNSTSVIRTTNERGFYKYGETQQCTYNTEIDVYESSSAEGPHVWLALEQDSNIFPHARAGKAHAHLNEEQARVLISRLQAFVDDIPSRWGVIDGNVE